MHETRLCRATLSCSVHKPACKRVTARCPGAKTNYAQVVMRTTQFGTMFSPINLIHSSPLIFRPGSTKCVSVLWEGRHVSPALLASAPPHVLVDGAAAALDARSLQTSANSGDSAAWCVFNNANKKHLGKNTRLILSLSPLFTNTNNSRTDRDVDREQRIARRCAAPSRPPSAASAITSAITASSSTAGRDLLVAHPLGCQLFSGVELLLRNGPFSQINCF